MRGFGKSPSAQDKEPSGAIEKLFGKKESLKASEPTDDSTVQSPERSEQLKSGQSGSSPDTEARPRSRRKKPPTEAERKAAKMRYLKH